MNYGCFSKDTPEKSPEELKEEYRQVKGKIRDLVAKMKDQKIKMPERFVTLEELHSKVRGTFPDKAYFNELEGMETGMSYTSPIVLIHQKIAKQIDQQIEDMTFKEFDRMGIIVDKEELLKALEYDRGQYEKGYKDRDSEIIRCKDCKYFHKTYLICENDSVVSRITDFDCCADFNVSPDWFCADGERRCSEDEEF